MKVFDHLFDDFFNQIIIDELQNASFNFASDPPPEGKSDSGFIHMSLHDGKVDSFISSKLNVYGEIITKKIFSLMPELNEYYPRRFCWNYYSKSSSGTYHQDTNTNNNITVVYYLNTCDGGTYIEDKFVQSESGRAVVFDSRTNHCGIGPTEYDKRYMLNIILTKEI